MRLALAMLPAARGLCAAALVAAGAAAATAPATLPTPAPAPAAAPAATARVAVGAEIPYAELPAYVGARVRVTTKYHTVREGGLEGASSIALNLRLDASEGGLLLGMPADTTVKVELVADAPGKP